MLTNHSPATNAVRACLAELGGTAMLVATVVGSGIMAAQLTDDVGVQLIINALATVAVLGLLITALHPTSGAHFNPAVTAVMVVRREIAVPLAAGYVACQVAGAGLGTVVAHSMYEAPLVTSFGGERNGSGQLIGEFVATAGLLAVILSGRGPVAVTVATWIGGAYFFTSSTSFANPAVTLGRALTDSFAGIRWADTPGFIAAQLLGAFAALAVFALLDRSETS